MIVHSKIEEDSDRDDEKIAIYARRFSQFIKKTMEKEQESNQ